MELALSTPTPAPHVSLQIAAALDGDPDAREALVRSTMPIIWSFARRMLRDDAEAADASQDAILKVLDHLDRYDTKRPFKPWVLQITRNTCIDRIRRRRATSSAPLDTLPSDAPTPLRLVQQQRRSEALHDALQTLPPMYREVLVLYHFEHLKYAEIADTLAIPIGTVMNRIFRARAKLRDALGGAQP